MNQNDRDIDRLLKANVDRQLADFDWDKLAQSVGGRLAVGEFGNRRGHWVRHSLAAAAAVLLVAGVVALVWLNHNAPNRDAAPRPGRATVVIASRVPEKRLGRCTVEIHSAAKPAPEDAAQRPRWCMVALPEPWAADVDQRRRIASLACLF